MYSRLPFSHPLWSSVSHPVTSNRQPGLTDKEESQYKDKIQFLLDSAFLIHQHYHEVVGGLSCANALLSSLRIFRRRARIWNPSVTSLHPRIHADIPSSSRSQSFSSSGSAFSRRRFCRPRPFLCGGRVAAWAPDISRCRCHRPTQLSSPQTVPRRPSSSIESSKISDFLPKKWY